MPKTMTVDDAEAMLGSIANGAGDFVRIPTHGKHLHAGGEAATVQAHITWARDRDFTKLATWIVDADDPDGQIRSLSRQFYGLSAILLSDEIRDRSGRDITATVREAGLDRLRTLQSERPRAASRGPQYEIICADHMGVSQPRLLYEMDTEGQGRLKGIASFETVARQIIATVLPRQTGAELDRGFTAALGSTLYELFRNTEVHARLDDGRRRLRRSLRCVQARLHGVTPTAIAAIVAKSPPLARYVESLRPARQQAAQIQLIEISVIDSGPGLAAAFTGRSLVDLPHSEELKAVTACFGKHATRKSSATAGLGLPNVIDTLRDRGGFLRIRTGKQALYADLSREPKRGYGEMPDLLPWFGPDSRPALAKGTLMTFLIPVIRHP